MKPFDLEKAKAGAKVCLGNGAPARIIAFDAKGHYPIVALVETGDIETAVRFTKQGRRNVNTEVDNPHIDLYMATVKRKVWVNMYLNKRGLVESGDSFETEGLAKKYWYANDKEYIATIPIEWEE